MIFKIILLVLLGTSLEFFPKTTLVESKFILTQSSLRNHGEDQFADELVKIENANVSLKVLRLEIKLTDYSFIVYFLYNCFRKNLVFAFV